MEDQLLERIDEIGHTLARLEKNRGKTPAERSQTRLRMLKLIAERIQLRQELIYLTKAG